MKNFTAKCENKFSGFTNTNRFEEATITFTECYFKAPYIIDLTDADLKYVTFTNCWVTSTQIENAPLNSSIIPAGTKKIVIDSDAQGRPTIMFFGSGDTLLKAKSRR